MIRLALYALTIGMLTSPCSRLHAEGQAQFFNASEREAVRKLEEAGVHVMGRYADSPPREMGELVSNKVDLSYVDDEKTASLIPQVFLLHHLKELAIGGRAVYDKDFPVDKGLPNLEIVGIGGPNVTGKILHIADHSPKLRSVIFSGGKLSASDLEVLTNLQDLQMLGLNRVKIDASIMSVIGKLKHLQSLNLSYTNVGDKQLSELRSLTLKRLVLSHTEVTREGLKAICALKQLENLQLAGLDLNDTDILSLEPLVKLKVLDISGTSVTKKSKNVLEEMFPKAKDQIAAPYAKRSVRY